MKGTSGRHSIREGGYLAEIEVEWLEDEHSWSPYLGVMDVRRIDKVREALRAGDFRTAAEMARVFELKPLTIRPTAAE
jgi:hypothetical protein